MQAIPNGFACSHATCAKAQQNRERAARPRRAAHAVHAMGMTCMPRMHTCAQMLLGDAKDTCEKLKARVFEVYSIHQN